MRCLCTPTPPSIAARPTASVASSSRRAVMSLGQPKSGQHGAQHRPELPKEVSWLGCEVDYLFPEAGGVCAADGYLSGECCGVLGEVCGEEG